MTDLDWNKRHDRKLAAVPTTNGMTAVPTGGEGDTKYGLAALTSEAALVAAAPEGTRNDALNTAWLRMGKVVAGGNLTYDTARHTLTQAARMSGLADTEIDLVLRTDSTSAFLVGASAPRIPPPLTPIPEVTVVELEPAIEATFWDERPILRHLHDFARARRVSPWAVLGVTLARIVTKTPHQVCLPPIVGGKASLNLFVGLVGPSGAGKGAAEAVAADALDIGHIEAHTTGSGEGIAHGYRRRIKGEVEWLDDDHAVLFSVAEIDTLAALGDRKGATLMPELRRAWSGEQLGFGYADPTKRLPVPAHEYRMCLVAGIQPARAGTLLNDSDGGTPQRFLWMPATDRDAPDNPPAEPPPRTWTVPRLGSLAVIGGNKVDVCETAKQTIVVNRLGRLRGDGDALDGHLLLAQLKVAAALGILDGRYTVTDDDWRIADTIIRKSSAVRAGVAAVLAAKTTELNAARAEAEATRAVHISAKVEDEAIRRVSQTIVRKLRREDGQAPASVLRKAVRSTDRGLFDEAIERLLGVGQIQAEIDPSGGAGTHGKGTQYELVREV